MNILLTGGTGLIGAELAHTLYEKGHKLWIVSRSQKSAKEKFAFPCVVLEHDLKKSPLKIPKEVEGIIHLAGENLTAKRWDENEKKEILESRTKTSEHLVESLHDGIKVLVSASAVGFYGDQGDQILTEKSKQGGDFLSYVCGEWEKAVLKSKIKIPEIKVSILRTGIVLSKKGGALKKMLPAFKLGGGAMLGSGDQWMSWVHIDDLVEAYTFLVETKADGVFNGCSPSPVTNKKFSKTLAEVLNRPLLLAVPSFALNILFGEMGGVLLFSQKALPENLKGSGFQFKYPELKTALGSILKK